MDRPLPRRPSSGPSVVDLYLRGCIGQSAVLSNGKVRDDARLLAERRYADFVNARPHSAPLSLSEQPTATMCATSPECTAVTRPHRVEDTSTTAAMHCCVCWSGPRDHAFAPCFHMVVCGECAARLHEMGAPCPVCRRDVAAVHRIYTA